MRSLFTLLIIFQFLQINLFSQSCDGTPPSTVTFNVSTLSALGALGDPTNSNSTICGFPPNANIVGLEWSNITANTTGDSWCEDLTFDLNAEVAFTPFITVAGPGGCGPSSGGSIFILQDNSLEITADATGCITIEAYLTYLTPPVGINVTAGSLTFTACPAGIALPIELKSISATSEGKQNLISWTTVSEVNNDVQMVERSSNGNSGWEMVGKVSGTNQNKETSYEIVDVKPLGMSYYRVHSIDFDGKEQFSKIVSVKRDRDLRGNVNSISPNPTSNYVDIALQPEFDSQITYNIMDATGKTVKTLVFSAVENTLNTHTLDISELNIGLYLVSIQGGGINQNTKIFKN
jgi:hypothetical protein